MPEVVARQTVFRTPWFSILEKHTAGLDADGPYYSVETLDYVAVVAITPHHDVLLVRQYRPAPEAYTLELPAGHVDPGQTPEQAARAELLEECGYTADRFELLGTLIPDSGRLSNRLWCFLALDAAPSPHGPADEPIESLAMPASELLARVCDGTFNHGLHVAALALALVRPGTPLSLF